jgi:FAD synthetase
MKRGVVMVFGVFDVIHPGHLRFLSSAKRLGSKLVVVVTRDAHAKAQKGKKPVMDENERLTVVSSLKMVDKAMLGDKGTPSVIRRLRPDVIAVGYDQDERHPKLLVQLKTMQKRPRVKKLPSHKPERYHSKLIKHTHARH